ncbi:TolC family protein [Robiginitalea biformata]|uniref:Outer membrane efflux protein n=1 Tax=Robiginitalea biformata (strain ATCC BAA-864 / DSM 15991 / KCTC 12146 / HTCC2501) TaxID=313596 RepID=A4CIX5_ROBBH|nr:TolC family protein [Robiginitalea biformata]EAR16883.1 outer membrane efflux protein [Robiginitalea biformata HTCC2501]
MKIPVILIACICCLAGLQAQPGNLPERAGNPEGQSDTLVLGFREFIAQVKQFHPLARQARLVLDAGEAGLLQARGGFDPKLEVDLERKEFKGTEYYDRLNATFKIPTWYGVEFKGQFSENDGAFLNPDEALPDAGLYSAGVSVSVGRGIWMDKRMAVLKKARLYRQQSQADLELLVNALLFEASLAYFDWLQAYQDLAVFEGFVRNARVRLEGIRQSALAGDRPTIDTVEARIAFANRRLSLEQARVRTTQAALEVSTYLWLEDDLPVELQPWVVPEVNPALSVDRALGLDLELGEDWISAEHPKLRSLQYKLEALDVERQLKASRLLPEIDLEYNFLTETPELLNSFDTGQYKGGLSFRMPLFLRKERGELKLAKIRFRDTELERLSTQVGIRNKVLGIFTELESFETQNSLIRDIVRDYDQLLRAEERKFEFGESSVFLINSRERALIDARLKSNEVGNKFLSAKAKLFQALALGQEEVGEQP